MYDGHLRNLNHAWQDNTDASGGEAGDQVYFLFGTVILGLISIFKNSQASSPYEALYSVEFLEKTLCPTAYGQGDSHHLTLREAHGVQYFERGRGQTLLENG